jgi:hypothetical protein
MESKQKQKMTIEFDLSNDDDTKVMEAINLEVSLANSSNVNHTFKAPEIIKFMIKPLNKTERRETLEKIVPESDRLKLWVSNYNKEKETNLSEMQFAVKILPNLTKSELKSLDTFH